jgi:HSP20 family protein
VQWSGCGGRHPRRTFQRSQREKQIPELAVYQNQESLTVEANLPNIKPGELEITITGSSLLIKAETKYGTGEADQEYLLRERRHSSFTRMLQLPSSLDMEKAEAHFENAVLTIIIPKFEEMKAKSIRVNVENR